MLEQSSSRSPYYSYYPTSDSYDSYEESSKFVLKERAMSKDSLLDGLSTPPISPRGKVKSSARVRRSTETHGCCSGSGGSSIRTPKRRSRSTTGTNPSESKTKMWRLVKKFTRKSTNKGKHKTTSDAHSVKEAEEDVKSHLGGNRRIYRKSTSILSQGMKAINEGDSMTKNQNQSHTPPRTPKRFSVVADAFVHTKIKKDAKVLSRDSSLSKSKSSGSSSSSSSSNKTVKSSSMGKRVRKFLHRKQKVDKEKWVSESVSFDQIPVLNLPESVSFDQIPVLNLPDTISSSTEKPKTTDRTWGEVCGPRIPDVCPPTMSSIRQTLTSPSESSSEALSDITSPLLMKSYSHSISPSPTNCQSVGVNRSLRSSENGKDLYCNSKLKSPRLKFKLGLGPIDVSRTEKFSPPFDCRDCQNSGIEIPMMPRPGRGTICACGELWKECRVCSVGVWSRHGGIPDRHDVIADDDLARWMIRRSHIGAFAPPGAEKTFGWGECPHPVMPRHYMLHMYENPQGTRVHGPPDLPFRQHVIDVKGAKRRPSSPPRKEKRKHSSSSRKDKKRNRKGVYERGVSISSDSTPRKGNPVSVTRPAKMESWSTPRGTLNRPKASSKFLRRISSVEPDAVKSSSITASRKVGGTRHFELNRIPVESRVTTNNHGLAITAHVTEWRDKEERCLIQH